MIPPADLKLMALPAIFDTKKSYRKVTRIAHEHNTHDLLYRQIKEPMI